MTLRVLGAHLEVDAGRAERGGGVEHGLARGERLVAGERDHEVLAVHVDVDAGEAVARAVREAERRVVSGRCATP